MNRKLPGAAKDAPAVVEVREHQRHGELLTHVSKAEADRAVSQDLAVWAGFGRRIYIVPTALARETFSRCSGAPEAFPVNGGNSVRHSRAEGLPTFGAKQFGAGQIMQNTWEHRR